jgi:1,4-dihydroxy-6-naphthoate synthase
MSQTPVTIAFSPDTDDAFMVHAMRAGLLDCGAYDFTYTAADIQHLNEQALLGHYDVTAISIAAYPSIAAEYLLMPIGASIGDAFGPALIVRQDSPMESVTDLKGKRIAVPGRQTSAFFAARGLIGDFIEVPMGFLGISGAVERGDVDAGILIHELQLDCEQRGFRKLGDLGALWHAASGLPLPLGANAIRRSLGSKAIHEITQLMRESIEVGLANREATLSAALKQSKAHLDQSLGDKYISMYVNARSLGMQADVRQAMAHLFTIGATAGLCPQVDLANALYD